MIFIASSWRCLLFQREISILRVLDAFHRLIILCGLWWLDGIEVATVTKWSVAWAIGLNDARWAVFILAWATQVQPQTNPLNPLMRYITAMTSFQFVYSATKQNKVTTYCVCIFAGNPICWKWAGPHQSRWFQSLLSVFTQYWDIAKYTHTHTQCLFVFCRKCLSVCEVQRDHCSLMLTTQKV